MSCTVGLSTRRHSRGSGPTGVQECRSAGAKVDIYREGTELPGLILLAFRGHDPRHAVSNFVAHARTSDASFLIFLYAGR